jgi:hypothetical protein
VSADAKACKKHRSGIASARERWARNWCSQVLDTTPGVRWARVGATWGRDAHHTVADVSLHHIPLGQAGALNDSPCLRGANERQADPSSAHHCIHHSKHSSSEQAAHSGACAPSLFMLLCSLTCGHALLHATVGGMSECGRTGKRREGDFCSSLVHSKQQPYHAPNTISNTVFKAE